MNICELIFFESKNKPLMLYVVYLEVFLQIFYNKNKIVCEFLFEKYLEINEFNSISNCKKIKTRMRFYFLKILTEIAVEFYCYLNQSCNGDVFVEIFNSFSPSRDYKSSYFKILNCNFSYQKMKTFCQYTFEALFKKITINADV